MKTYFVVTVSMFFCLLLISSAMAKDTATINNSSALQEVHIAKGLFDVAVSEAKSLEFYLNVIQRTYDDLVQGGVKPDLVIAFRGPSVRLINTETWSLSEEDQATLKRASALLSRLKGEGVKLEACSVATELFKVDNATILPDIQVVGNTFVSLIGYQAQGYGLVPIK